MGDTGVVLEMTDPSHLRIARQRVPIVVEEVQASAASLIGQLYKESWLPFGGGGRNRWPAERWATELVQPGIRTWVARLDEQPVGFAEMEWLSDGNVGIVEIGTLPSVQGMGIDGDFVTRMTQLAWQTLAPNGTRTARVWLWTRRGEHPHTIPNYLARGYRGMETGGQ